MPPQFLYFDLGNVLLTFSNEGACDQLAELAGVESAVVRGLLFNAAEKAGFLWRFERGDVTEAEFYHKFCRAVGCRPPLANFERAASDMFAPIHENLQLVELLAAQGHRLGVLSNTNPYHWRFVTDGRYAILSQAFELAVTSFEARSMKPEPRIFVVAQARAGVPAESIFFVDDREENVIGARQAGFDAVLYRDPPTLRADLQQRGVLASND